jgi:hypothetical protein
MPKCAFLTIKDLSNFECYDDKLIQPMSENGWVCDFIPWDKQNVDWNQYDLAIVRSTWDYQDRIDEFLKVLKEIDSSNCILQNSLELIKWNIDKDYLKNLSNKNVKIVPSLFFNKFSVEKFKKCFPYFSTNKLVIKPNVSANADNTYVVSSKDFSIILTDIEEVFKNRKHIVQPFIENIVDEGEYSLIFFQNRHSHTLLKKPSKGDFRVQEEHGGKLNIVKNTEKKLLETAKDIIKKVPFESLYSRIDLVRCKETFLLMEIELIEPSLYFNLKPDAANQFSSIIQSTFNNRFQVQ